MNREMIVRAAALVALLLTAAACGRPLEPAAGQPGPQPTPDAAQPTASPAPADAPPAPAIDPAQPCTREAPAGGATGQGAPTEPEVSYRSDDDTILLTAGTGVTIPDLSRAIDNPDLLRELAPGEWLLGAGLEIGEGASLLIQAPEVRWLKLRSDADRFAPIIARGGDLTISGTCITSWDEGQGSVDTALRDGRSYLLARSGGGMTIDGAELRYLGYEANESYGLAWRLEGTGGGITQSIVSHNYYGLYSYEVSDLIIQDNQFHHNVLYGIDPHTRSHRLRIERNVVHDNGKHGIILADECTDSVIRENRVYRNLHHGIVLYGGSDNNLVEANESFLNSGQGININDAADNIVRGNRVYGNHEAGVGVGQNAANNVIEHNEIRGNQEDGIKLYSEAAKTTLDSNLIGDNPRYGVYVDTGGGARLIGNTISGSQIGVLLKGPAEASPDDNTLFGNRDGDIRQGS